MYAGAGSTAGRAAMTDIPRHLCVTPEPSPLRDPPTNSSSIGSGSDSSVSPSAAKRREPYPKASNSTTAGATMSRQIAGIWNAAMSGKSKERWEQREDRQEKNPNKTGQDKTAALTATPAASVQGSYKDKSKAEQSTISTACYRTPPRPKSRAEQSSQQYHRTFPCPKNKKVQTSRPEPFAPRQTRACLSDPDAHSLYIRT